MDAAAKTQMRELDERVDASLGGSNAEQSAMIRQLQRLLTELHTHGSEQRQQHALEIEQMRSALEKASKALRREKKANASFRRQMRELQLQIDGCVYR